MATVDKMVLADVTFHQGCYVEIHYLSSILLLFFSLKIQEQSWVRTKHTSSCAGYRKPGEITVGTWDCYCISLRRNKSFWQILLFFNSKSESERFKKIDWHFFHIFDVARHIVRMLDIRKRFLNVRRILTNVRHIYSLHGVECFNEQLWYVPIFEHFLSVNWIDFYSFWKSKEIGRIEWRHRVNVFDESWMTSGLK